MPNVKPVEEKRISDSAEKRHELKCWPPHFENVLSGRKTFEIRENHDRDFQVGDTLYLCEYDNTIPGYSGRSCERRITYLLGDGDWGIEKGVVVMALQATPPDGRIGEEEIVEQISIAETEAEAVVDKKQYGRGYPWAELGEEEREETREEVRAAVRRVLPALSTQPSDGRISVELTEAEVERILDSQIGWGERDPECCAKCAAAFSACSKLRAALTHNPQGAKN